MTLDQLGSDIYWWFLDGLRLLDQFDYGSMTIGQGVFTVCMIIWLCISLADDHQVQMANKRAELANEAMRKRNKGIS